MDFAIGQKGEMMDDTISRQAAIDGKISVQRTNGVEIYSDDVVPVKYLENLPSAQPEPIMVNIDHELTQEGYEKLRKDIANAPIMLLPSAQPEIIHCKDCIYYDPEHVEKNGVRYEYSDMPKDAFDIPGTRLVRSEYGVNVGGRCCRDYNVGYPEDKRVFVSEQNYCGRAERKKDAAD